MDFQLLSKNIQQAHTLLYQNAIKAVNTHISLRNWLIGFYIVEFEQHGKDRAQYGARLLSKLAGNIHIKGLTAPELSRCRQFYNIYNEFLGSVTQKFNISKVAYDTENPFSNLLTKISFTHFVELIKIKDDNKRKFYEFLVVKNTLSVRELEHQY